MLYCFWLPEVVQPCGFMKFCLSFNFWGEICFGSDEYLLTTTATTTINPEPLRVSVNFNYSLMKPKNKNDKTEFTDKTAFRFLSLIYRWVPCTCICLTLFFTDHSSDSLHTNRSHLRTISQNHWSSLQTYHGWPYIMMFANRLSLSPSCPRSRKLSHKNKRTHPHTHTSTAKTDMMGS